MCLILIDFTRSEKGSRWRAATNVTSTPSAGDDGVQLHHNILGVARADGIREERYPHHRLIRGYYGRSLKGSVEQERADDRGAEKETTIQEHDDQRHARGMSDGNSHYLTSTNTSAAGVVTSAALPEPSSDPIPTPRSGGWEDPQLPVDAGMLAEVDPQDSVPSGAMALPYRGAADLVRPGPLPGREDWLDAVPSQRRNYYSEVGAIQGEHILLPDQPVLSQGAQRLVKLLGPQGKPARLANQNQYLVVNNKGVVIPHSVNFPEVVKTSNFPQLQSYKNYQNSLGTKNLQDVINYLASRGVGYVTSPFGGLGENVQKPSSWNNLAARVPPGKLPGMSQGAPDYEGYMYPRTEHAVNDGSLPHMPLEKVTDLADRPEIPYNGHAYIVDPFHPYKPSDPTEINQMASDLEMSLEGERPRLQLGEEASESSSVYARQHSKLGRMRLPFLKQYTEAAFKPLVEPLAAPDSSASAAVKGSPGASPAGKRLAPLSLMLEIYPMGDARGRGDARGGTTVNWNGHPVATLRPVLLRRPPMMVHVQGDASHKRPLLAGAMPLPLPMDVPTPVSQMAAPFRYPSPVMHGQLGLPNRAPAFGVTLSGLQGLQGLQGSGVPMPDSKHRMIVMLNFYPKKTMSLPVKQRDAVTEAAGQGAALLPGGTFSQRRQSDDSQTSAPEPAGLAVDVAPLLQSLPRDIRRQLNAILRTYQRARKGEDLHVDEERGGESSSDYLEDDYDTDELEEANEDDDLDSFDERKPRKNQDAATELSAVDAEPSDVEDGDDDDSPIPGINQPRHRAPLLLSPARGRWQEEVGRGTRRAQGQELEAERRRKRGRVRGRDQERRREADQESYFDVQDFDYEGDTAVDNLRAEASRQGTSARVEGGTPGQDPGQESQDGHDDGEGGRPGVRGREGDARRRGPKNHRLL